MNEYSKKKVATKREIARDVFEVSDVLGSGNFGKVFKGEVQGVYQRNDKLAVAVKCINDSKNDVELEYFLEEIKIMSAIDQHVNLVNMIGSCTSESRKNKNKMCIFLETSQCLGKRKRL